MADEQKVEAFEPYVPDIKFWNLRRNNNAEVENIGHAPKSSFERRVVDTALSRTILHTKAAESTKFSLNCSVSLKYSEMEEPMRKQGFNLSLNDYPGPVLHNCPCWLSMNLLLVLGGESPNACDDNRVRRHPDDPTRYDEILREANIATYWLDASRLVIDPDCKSPGAKNFPIVVDFRRYLCHPSGDGNQYKPFWFSPPLGVRTDLTGVYSVPTGMPRNLDFIATMRMVASELQRFKSRFQKEVNRNLNAVGGGKIDMNALYLCKELAEMRLGILARNVSRSLGAWDQGDAQMQSGAAVTHLEEGHAIIFLFFMLMGNNEKNGSLHRRDFQTTIDVMYQLGLAQIRNLVLTGKVTLTQMKVDPQMIDPKFNVAIDPAQMIRAADID